MDIKKLKMEDLDEAVKILHQDPLRYCDGDYPGVGWTSDFINNERGFTFGLWDGGYSAQYYSLRN